MSKSVNNDERALELHAIIGKAERELQSLEPRRSFLEKLEEELHDFDARRESGNDYESIGISLANTLVDALNILNERLQGNVRMHQESLTISTDVGTMTYDVDSEEWYFTERI